EGRVAEQHRDERGGDDHAEAEREEGPGPQRRRGVDLVETAGQVAERERGRGHEAADEASTGLVVAGEEQVDGQHQGTVEHEADGGVDDEGAARSHEPTTRDGSAADSATAGWAAAESPERRRRRPPTSRGCSPTRASATMPIPAAT